MKNKKIKLYIDGSEPKTFLGFWLVRLITTNLPYEFTPTKSLINADLVILREKYILNKKHREILTPQIKKASDNGTVLIAFTGENRDEKLLKEVCSDFDLCMAFRPEHEFDYNKYGGPKNYLRYTYGMAINMDFKRHRLLKSEQGNGQRMNAYYDKNPSEKGDFFDNSFHTYEKWLNRKDNAAFFAKHTHFPRKEIFDICTEVLGSAQAYGGYLHNTEVEPMKIPKHEVLPNAKFNICPENAIGVGYCTEKLYHAFIHGCIPIYYGNPDPEPNVFNKDRILFYDPESEDELKEKIYKIVNDKDYGEEFFAKPVLVDGAEAHIKHKNEQLIEIINNLLKKFE